MEDLFNIEDLKLGQSTLDQIITNPDYQEENKIPKETEEVITPEESKENKTEEKLQDTTPSQSQDDSSTFSVFANLLKEEGVLSLEEEDLKDIKSSADLVEAVKKQIDKSKFENLSESQKRYLEAVEAGIPQSEYERIEKQLSQLEAITDETLEKNAQARFDLIAYDYISKGLPKEKAVALANASIKLETDIEDAKEALISLKALKAEEYKKTVTEKKEQNKISLEELKTKIDSKENVLKEIKLTPKLKTDLYNLLSVKVDTDEAGQPINEFNKWRKDQGLEAEIILAAVYQLTNKFQNLGKILEVSKSKASQELEKKLKQVDVSELTTESMSTGGFTINI